MGIVYAIDVALLDQYGVRMYRVSEIVGHADALGSSEDDEHALVGTPPAELPIVIVAEQIVVKGCPASRLIARQVDPKRPFGGKSPGHG